ncbi:RNA polymerase factor sigma-54 [Virgibacillus sp. 6R]|uniref:RNA polymerase factor sigma-54 n=1 Tax=Metabacillus sp. 22489 TaxID=3453928 RepID=UPI0011A03224
MMKMENKQVPILSVKMTKELQQAITLLQYSTVELYEYVQELSLENPVLELLDVPIRTIERLPKNMQTFENTIVERNSLKDYLREQLIDYPLSKRADVEYLIENLDQNGYLVVDIELLAEENKIEQAALEKSLELLQSLDPPGVGARTLQECILLQLKRLSPRYELAETVIFHHFHCFAEKSWRSLSAKLNEPIHIIQEISLLIQTLNPRPGASFESNLSSYITPDFTVNKHHGHLQLIFHDELLPQLTLNPFLNKCKDKEIENYIKEKRIEARWLLNALQHRKETMMNIMEVILNKQADYFLNGKLFLKPLKLKEVAEILNIHESTVSRAVKEKYIRTPYGLVPMKSFFSGKLVNSEISTASVKERLKELIDEEDKRRPYSDQSIANELKDRYGIVISRRTVTKYRELLRIPSAAIRRQFS